MQADVVVVGHIGRDIVLQVEGLPGSGTRKQLIRRLEMLGGKGANQAVALAQLGHRPALVGAVGDDQVGYQLLLDAKTDGVEVTGTALRIGGQSSLIVSIVEPDGVWRYLEDLTPESYVHADDVQCATAYIQGARAVSLQMQQAADANLEAARIARRHDVLVFADGVPPPGFEDALLEMVDVLRADHREAGIMAQGSIGTVDEAVDAARALLDKGPDVVALATEDADVVAWRSGEVAIRHQGTHVTDTTGAGDAFMAGLISGLIATNDPFSAACVAATTAARTVGRLGGRPDLDVLDVWTSARGLSRSTARAIERCEPRTPSGHC